MKSLIREQFLNLTWGVADLDAAAEFWLRLYERVASSRRYNPSPRHAIELRLTGFPVHAGDESASRVGATARLASDVRRPDVHLCDPHTLVLYSEPEPGGAAPPTGLGLPVLAGPPFDGLIAEVRFIASGREGGYIKTGTATVALVIIGELRNGKLLVKSIWRSGSSRWEDEVYWSNPSPEEAALIAALEEFRRTGEVDNRLARRMFKESSEDHLGRWMMRLIYVPFGGPRLLSLLCRVAVLALLNVGLGILIYLTVAAEKWILLVPCVIFGLYVLTLSWHFFRYEVSWLKCRRDLMGRVRGAIRGVGRLRHTPDRRIGSPVWRPGGCKVHGRDSGLRARPRRRRRQPNSGGPVCNLSRLSSALDGASYLVLICQAEGSSAIGVVLRNVARGHRPPGANVFHQWRASRQHQRHVVRIPPFSRRTGHLGPDRPCIRD